MKKNIIAKIADKFKAISFYKNPVLYIQDLLGLIKGKKVVYELKNGLKYEVRAGTCDRGIIDEIYAYACYTPAGFEIKEGDTVIDVGAQIGIFSTYAAHLSKTGKVYSFEPFPENFNMLQKNIDLNSLYNIEAFPVALAAQEGSMDFFLSDNSGGHSLHGSDKQSKISVRGRTLASFMTEKNIAKVDYFKIDCEGGEYDIFFNSGDEVFSKISKIGMEYHNLDEARNVDKMKAFLEGKGFEVEVAKGIFPMLYAKKK
jgi:FkbM family methyltransferase